MKSTWYSRNREVSIERAKAWRLANLERHNRLKDEWAKRNPERVKKIRMEARWRRKGVIGATYEQFMDLKEAQNNLCAICGEKPGKRQLNFDHCHKTGKPRGLLCTACNIGLGWFVKHRSLPEWVEKADNYLKSYEDVKST